MWREGDGILHLFLDALDEGMVSVDTLHSLLVDELEERTTVLDRKRLRLRVACRTLLWPGTLEQRLKEIWPADEFAIYQLAPLTRQDVKKAVAKKEGVAADDFLESVKQCSAEPLAAKPITLRMLLDLYHCEHQLPSSQVELYEQGCRALCQEPNPDRRDRKAMGLLDAGERFELASRFAAAMVFGHRRFVVLDDVRAPEDEEITLPEILGQEAQDELAIRDRDLRDVLEFSALFTGAGTSRMEWAHQTYAEFLATRYVQSKGLDGQRALALLVHPESPESGVVPQHQGTAAWLACMYEEVFTTLLDLDPATLLKSDLATMKAEQKERLVDAVLKEEEARDPHLLDLSSRQFSRLNHPGLDKQLAPLLCNPERAFYARLTATCLAGRCKRPELLQDLLQLALDTAEEVHLRTSSIAALAQIGDPAALRRLRSLLPGDRATEEDHWIGANVIRALWPDALSAEEFFETLRRAEQRDCLGKYSFLFYRSRELELQPVDLPMALAWVAATGTYGGLIEGTHRSIVLAIFNRAWSLMESPGVTSAFAQAVARMSHDHCRFSPSEEFSKFFERFVAESARRRRFLGALFKVVDSDSSPYFGAPWEMILRADSAWFLSQVENARSARRKKLLSRLVARTFDAQDYEFFERTYQLAQADPILHEGLREWIGPIELNSELAELLRETYEHNQKWSAESAAEKVKRVSQRPPSQQIDDLLDRAEAGDAECWWRINLLLGFDDENVEIFQVHHGQLTDTPGWATADPARRQRLLDTAHRYLLHAYPHTEEWIEDTKPGFDLRPQAAYRAFRLFCDEGPALLQNLSPAIWKKWTPAILYFMARSIHAVE